MRRDRDKTPRVEVDEAVLEWEASPTTIADDPPLDAIPEIVVEPDPEPGHPTPPQGLAVLPGYEVGFEDGQLAGARMVLSGMREVLIEGGTDIGVAYLVTDKLRRRLGLKGF